jgi:hypothetical protein
LKKEKTFVYVLKTLLFTFLYVTLSGCGGGSNNASSPVTNNPTQDNTNNPSTDENKTTTTIPNTDNTSNNTGPWKDHGALKIASDKRMLQHTDGTGFFWMADTAWFLYTKTKAEIDTYINDRAAKKFTVIQAVAAHDHASHIIKSYSNADDFDRAFTDFDISKPNEKYWEKIDYIVKKAEEKGMYVALLPVWRDAMKKIPRENVNRTFETVADATNYGTWIAKRYKDDPNIIWIIGGDAPLDTKWATEAGMLIPDQVARWNALGEAIKSVDTNHLRTFHPGPKVTKPYAAVTNNTWIDFNMIQSSRFGPVDSIKNIKTALDEGLPTVDGESLYEGLAYPKKADGSRGEETRRTAFQVREDAYSQIFAGAFGNTYGHDAIWRFCVNKEDMRAVGDGKCKSIASFLLAPIVTWQEALNAKGAKQMQYVTELMQSRPIVGRKPDQSLISGNPKAEDSDRIIATLGNGYAMLYSPKGKNINVVMGKVSGSMVKAWWFNPRDGKSTLISEYQNSGTQTFEPVDENDWVLVLDDTSKGFGTPGK